MRSRILIGAAAASFIMAVAGPTLSFAAHKPITKQQCIQHKNMKWDKASNHCIKK